MLIKLLRTIIGLPVILLIWFVYMLWIPLAIFVFYVLFNDKLLFKSNLKEIFYLPWNFLKAIWQD